MKYIKTKYPNIFTYQTSQGKFYYVRRSFIFQNKKKEITKSGLKTLPEARIVLADMDKRIEEQTIVINKNITVADYWKIFYNKRTKTNRWTPNTEVYYKSTFKNHILPHYGDIKLKELSRNEYENHIAGLLNVKPRDSVKIINSCFMAMLNDAVLNGNITTNRLKQIYIGESAIPPQNKKVTLEQFRIWIQKAQEIMPKTFFALTYLTIFGLRRGEVFGLRTCDITTNINGRALLSLHDSRCNHTKNGRHGLKTLSSERWVTLDETGTELIQYLLSEAERIKKKHSIIKEDEWDYISLREDGELINPNRLNYQFEKVNDQVGFRITPHMMRHFFTTQSIIAGVSIEALSQVLGHTKVYMTDRYNQVHDELSERVSDAFIDHIAPQNSPLKSPPNIEII